MQCDRQSFIHVAANSGQRGGLIPRKQRLHQPAMLIQRGLIAAIGAIALHIMCHEEVHVGVVLALKLLHLRIGDPQRVFEAIRGGLAGSTVMNAKAPMMISGEFKPGFRIDLHIKDLHNALDTGEASGSPLPLCAQAMQIFQNLKADGCEKLNHSAMALYYEKLSGQTIG